MRTLTIATGQRTLCTTSQQKEHSEESGFQLEISYSRSELLIHFALSYLKRNVLDSNEVSCETFQLMSPRLYRLPPHFLGV
jgi:hypothetical protein